MKYLLLIAFAAVIWWVWKKRSQQPAERSAPVSAAPEQMVSCAHCGVFLPQSDGIIDEGVYFCTEAHRQAGKSAGRP